jgi:hypothetical protein
MDPARQAATPSRLVFLQLYIDGNRPRRIGFLGIGCRLAAYLLR